jgi:Ca-activated chloride channel family protein
MNFDSPQWLLLLALVPLLIFMIRFDYKNNRNTPFMKFSKSYGSKFRFVRHCCVVVSLLLLIVAAAKPVWGTEFVKSPTSESELVIVLDVSYSMLADDLKPTRSRVASDSIIKLLPYLRGYRVGLVIFAGDAFERAPVTDDFKSLSFMLQRAQDESFLLEPGSNVVSGIEKASEILHRNEIPHSKLILLVSDGEFDEVNDLSSVVSDSDTNVFTAFAASKISGQLPNGYVSSGQPTHLELLAQQSDGSFWEIQDLPGLAVSLQRMRSKEYVNGVEEISKSRSNIFIGTALFIMAFLLVSPSIYGWFKYRQLFNSIFMVGLTGTLLGLVSCASPSVDKQINTANSYYANHQYNVSLIEYQRISNEISEVDDWKIGSILYNLGNNLHRLARYDEAFAVSSSALQFAKDDQVLAGKIRYSLGLHSYRKGDFEQAYRWFSEVLSHRPTDIDAKINLEITLRELDSTPEVGADTSQKTKDQTKKSGLESPDDTSGTWKPKTTDQSESDGESGIKGTKAAIGSKGNTLETGDAGHQVVTRQMLDDIFQKTVISLSKLEALEILDLVTEENREINYPYTSRQGLIVK